ncbi:MAG: hypothetical protein HY092_01470 [Candidatus Kerfeldbacteria bacterium]|nr:hypothetical protein [Candidatus Kerfeldbacteria bacterium]
MSLGRTIIISLSLALALLLAPRSFPIAQAVEKPITFTPEVVIPGTDFSGKPVTADSDLAGKYLRAIFIYFIWGVGILATVMVTFAGVKWVSAAGNPGAIKDARDMLNNAIIGVIIALTSVLLLRIINPQLVNIGLPDLGGVTGLALQSGVTEPCDSDLNIQCGTIKQIGMIKINASGVPDPKGTKEINRYCAGTICPFDGFQPTACSLTRDAKTGFFGLGGGCVKTVSVSGNLDPNTYGHNSSFNLGFPLKCGKIQPSVYGSLAGATCDNDQDKTSSCLIENQPQSITTSGTLKNMYCADDPTHF